ncbi:MAG: hypothetical protein ACREMU_12240, partial [Gemmatimonadaceae bacterium]
LGDADDARTGGNIASTTGQRREREDEAGCDPGWAEDPMHYWRMSVGRARAVTQITTRARHA